MVDALRRLGLVACAMTVLLAMSIAAWAQDHCLAVAQGPNTALVHKAGMRVAEASEGAVRITFAGHATFLIESPKGIKIATDYNDYIRAPVVPDIATMNRAHDTHFSYHPDPAIRYILRGWNPDGGQAIHDLTVADVHIRNVVTNTRDWNGGTIEFGNSIFVFEVANLCIAHLGHIHHTLTVQQLSQLGQMDILLVPVDGSYTIDLPGMIEVLRDLKPRIIIPMHYFSRFGLDRFLNQVRSEFEVIEQAVPTITVSRTTLPDKQQVIVLPGR
jgi:L-ascorbate metabolism protein UlaG (beta-lactamase superfamily)